jgi:succinate-semialdehyde dehydrogenase / glutarate-semialdehyde dehydrogenase
MAGNGGENTLQLRLSRPDLLRDRGLIDGVWTDAQNGAVFSIRDPASLKVVQTVSRMGALEARRAVDAAQAALPFWSRRTAKERSALLRKWFESILAHTEDLSLILTAEQGKPLAEAAGEIAYAASFIEWFAEEGKRVYGDVIPSPRSDTRILVTKGPVGVAAAITPWNFPAAMITRKAGAALAAGCTVVIKPSELTPLTAFALGLLATESGIPAGVINIVTGDAPAIGEVWTSDPRVRKLTFTGSTAVGKRLVAACAPTLKRVSMELGGNAPFIVFEDADLEVAVTAAIASKFRNTGQTCVCANRLLVHESVYDAFTQKLAARIETLRMGAGLSGTVELGPLINEQALIKVQQHVSDAVSKGATVVMGGRRSDEHGPGAFYLPTILADASESMLLAREETFGPVAPLFRFSSDAEALRIANATSSGLAAYMFTRDLGRALRISEALETGMVGINTGLISTEVAPFGGVKDSGIGREGSRYGIEEFLDIKYVCIGAVQGAD